MEIPRAYIDFMNDMVVKTSNEQDKLNESVLKAKFIRWATWCHEDFFEPDMSRVFNTILGQPPWTHCRFKTIDEQRRDWFHGVQVKSFFCDYEEVS